MDIFEGQISFFDEPAGITQEEIRRCLLQGSGIEGGRGRILQQYSKGMPAKDNVAFLRDEYGTGGCCPAYRCDDPQDELWLDYNASGIKITRAKRWSEQVHLDWPKVARMIGELIESGEYERSALNV